MKNATLQQKLELVEQRLRNAEEYVARGENVVSDSFLHIKDWDGKSGHPKWMKNYMIPSAKKARARMEKAVERIAVREKEKASQRRTNRG